MGNMDLTNSQNENAKLAAGMESGRETEATRDATLVAAARTDACAAGSAASEARAQSAVAPASEHLTTPQANTTAAAAPEAAAVDDVLPSRTVSGDVYSDTFAVTETETVAGLNVSEYTSPDTPDTCTAPPPKRKGRWLDRLRGRLEGSPAEAARDGAMEAPPETGPGLMSGTPPEAARGGTKETPPEAPPDGNLTGTPPRTAKHQPSTNQEPTKANETNNETDNTNQPKPMNETQEPNKADAMDNLHQTNMTEPTDNQGGTSAIGGGAGDGIESRSAESINGAADGIGDGMDHGTKIDAAECTSGATGSIDSSTESGMNQSTEGTMNDSTGNEAVNAADTEGFEMTESHEVNDSLNVAADEQETTMDAKRDDLQNESMPAAGIDSTAAEPTTPTADRAMEAISEAVENNPQCETETASIAEAAVEADATAEAVADATVENSPQVEMVTTEADVSKYTTPDTHDTRSGAPEAPRASSAQKEAHWLARAAKDASLRDQAEDAPSAASRVGVSYRSFTHRTPSRPLSSLTREASAAQAAANRAAATKTPGAAIAARAAAAQAAGPDRPGEPSSIDPTTARVQRKDKRRRFGRKALASFMAVVLAIGLCPLPAFGDDGQIEGVTFNGATATIEHKESTTTTVDENGNTVTTSTSETTVTQDGTDSDELTPEQQEANNESMRMMYSQVLYNQQTKDKSTIDSLSGYKASEDTTLPLSAGIEAEKAANATAYFQAAEGDGTTGNGPDAEPATDGNFFITGSGTLAKEDHRFTGYFALGDGDKKADLAAPSGAKVTGWKWDAVIMNDQVIGYVDNDDKR